MYSAYFRYKLERVNEVRTTKEEWGGYVGRIYKLDQRNEVDVVGLNEKMKLKCDVDI